MKLKKIAMMLLTFALTFVSVVPICAKDDVVELTLDDAVKKALAHSSSLISAQLDAEILQEKMDDVDAEDIGNYTPTQRVSYFKQAANYANSKLNQQVKEESVRFSLKQAYIDVLNNESVIALETAKLYNTAKELEVTRVKVERGLIAETEWQNQKLAYDKSKKELEQTQQNVDAAYRALSILIGLDKNTKYSLTLEPVYQKLELSLTLDGYINNKLATDLNIQQLVRNVETAESEKRITYATISDNVYANQEASSSLTTAELNLQDSKTKLSDSIMNCYNSIIALQDSIELNQLELESLKQAQLIASTKLEIKTGTQIEYNNAQSAVEAMENTITKQIYQHMLLMEQFDKSYLL